MADDINHVKQLCFERDAFRCRHCGTQENIDAVQLDDTNESRFSWHLSNLITLCDSCWTQKSIASCNKDSNRVGVMLCGGKGTRLYPLTKFHNKHALSIGILPMCMHPLKSLRHLGVHRVVVVLDRDTAGEIIAILGSGKEFGMDISYRIQEGATGIGKALYLARDAVRPDNDIVCILGDNIFDNSELNQNYTWRAGKSAQVFVKNVPNPQDYGVADIQNGEILKIVEKPKEFISNFGVIGLYIYRGSAVFDVIESIHPSDRGELEISDVNQFFVENNMMQYDIVKGYWGDSGSSIQKYTECNIYGTKLANVSSEEIESFRSKVFDDK